MENCDYYCTLGIDRTASEAEIKKAYRRQAQRLHPDVTDDPEGESKFKRLGEAYKTLRRADTRSAYNLQLVTDSPVISPALWLWIAFPPDLCFALLPWPLFTWLWRH
ncbi:J domain-containing protein [Dechloromonas denitrificans]|nr:J domain-containing protein [Dechloromonas denitrificans]